MYTHFATVAVYFGIIYS